MLWIIYKKNKKTVGGVNMDIISKTFAIIFAIFAFVEWLMAEEKEDKIYAAVMMILAVITWG